MITEIRINNFKAFNEPVKLSMKADNRTTRFYNNYFELNEKNKILKSLAIFGPNNTGKSCLVHSIQIIKDLILDEKLPVVILENIFNDINTGIDIGVNFIGKDNIEYYADFKFLYNLEKGFGAFEILKEEYGKVNTTKPYILRDYTVEPSRFEFEFNANTKESLNKYSRSNLLINMLIDDYDKDYTSFKAEFFEFAKNITIVSADSLSLNYTVEMMKAKNNFSKKLTEIITKADLKIKDFEYAEHRLNAAPKNSEESIEIIREYLKNTKGKPLFFPSYEPNPLVSYYGDTEIPFGFIDSLGTKKFISIASYILDAITNNKILVIDEIDDSLHFMLTREIVRLFNTSRNKSGQLIFTTHDIALLDINKLLRKDQIYFTDKDEDRTYLYSLQDISREGDADIRGNSKIIPRYKQGLFGALPDPDIVNFLFGNEK